ncbi:hypothetical protein [Sorangium sp. So ce233]|uniref:hypothetical protein n=1 Tax=Sorangium sp. So ce233 TaxID=3133290 RepID=UPI003F60D0B2
MSEHQRLVPWREMVPGQVYRSPSAWTDDGGQLHEGGEEWTFLRLVHVMDTTVPGYQQDVPRPHVEARDPNGSRLSFAVGSEESARAIRVEALPDERPLHCACDDPAWRFALQGETLAVLHCPACDVVVSVARGDGGSLVGPADHGELRELERALATSIRTPIHDLVALFLELRTVPARAVSATRLGARGDELLSTLEQWLRQDDAPLRRRALAFLVHLHPAPPRLAPAVERAIREAWTTAEGHLAAGHHGFEELLDALKAAHVVAPHLSAHRGTFSRIIDACRSSSEPGAGAAQALASSLLAAITAQAAEEAITAQAAGASAQQPPGVEREEPA